MNNTVVLGVIGADIHTIGNKIIDFALSKEGYNVINLGVMVSQQEFIDAAIETNASAILVSSLYGHGEIDCRGIRDKCIESGIGDILLYIGGNLVIGKTPFKVVQKRFSDMGFDRIFPPGTSPETDINCLKEDILKKNKVFI